MPFAASALYRELKGRFGAENIFFDAGTLRQGMEFLEEITSRLSGTAGAFLALIGPEWLPTMEAHRRRLRTLLPGGTVTGPVDTTAAVSAGNLAGPWSCSPPTTGWTR